MRFSDNKVNEYLSHSEMYVSLTCFYNNFRPKFLQFCSMLNFHKPAERRQISQNSFVCKPFPSYSWGFFKTVKKASKNKSRGHNCLYSNKKPSLANSGSKTLWRYMNKTKLNLFCNNTSNTFLNVYNGQRKKDAPISCPWQRRHFKNPYTKHTEKTVQNGWPDFKSRMMSKTTNLFLNQVLPVYIFEERMTHEIFNICLTASQSVKNIQHTVTTICLEIKNIQ